MKEFVRKQGRMIALTITVLVLSAVGISYAVWNQTNKSETQSVKSGILNVTYGNGTVITGSNGEMSPLSDTEGMATTPFTLTVNNTSSTLPADYVIKIKNNTGITNPLSHQYLKISIDGGAATTVSSLVKEYTAVSSYGGNSEDNTIYVLKNTSIAKGATVNHNIRVWLDEGTPASESGKKVNLVVEVSSVVSEDICNLYPDTLTCKILANNGGQSTIKGKAAPDFSVINGTNGMYTAIDETGKTSYYFRGTNALNNNVIFGGQQWKIVRITGEGHIKLIYNGECANDTCTINTTGASTQVKTTAYNGAINNAKYVGYTYDTDTDSTIKVENETWYANNMVDYDEYIADVVYCNDQTSRVEGTTTYYGVYDRLRTTKAPTLKCSQDADKYTKDSNTGNKLLDEKVGLISADEVYIAGIAYGIVNTTNYLYTNQTYWTMTPSFWNNTNSNVEHVFSDGTIYANKVSDTYGLRPVISLQSTVEWISGNGSATTPYKIEMNR